MNKIATHQIVSHFTAKRLTVIFDVSDHMIRHIRTTGAFPGSWFNPLKILCEAEGIECPADAFTWKPARLDQHAPSAIPGDSLENQTCQGVAE